MPTARITIKTTPTVPGLSDDDDDDDDESALTVGGVVGVKVGDNVGARDG